KLQSCLFDWEWPVVLDPQFTLGTVEGPDFEFHRACGIGGDSLFPSFLPWLYGLFIQDGLLAGDYTVLGGHQVEIHHQSAQWLLRAHADSHIHHDLSVVAASMSLEHFDVRWLARLFLWRRRKAPYHKHRQYPKPPGMSRSLILHLSTLPLERLPPP